MPARQERFTKQCDYCKKTMLLLEREISTKKFCSRACKDSKQKGLFPISCEWCKEPFVPSNSGVRFCSRKCWFRFHRGENHKQFKRFPSMCEVCNKTTMKTFTQINRTKHQYCSRKCSDSAHGAKIAGENNANWKGGAISSRGPSWNRIRYEIRKKQDFKCGICNMTEDEHRLKYHRVLTVHHKTIYRLTLSNAEEGLIALCVKCHAIEEAKLNKQLTPRDLEIIRKNTERTKALGLDRAYIQKDPCPRCGIMKTHKSKHCRKCSSVLRFPNHIIKRICPQCKGNKIPKSIICRGCKKANRLSRIGNCSICNVHLKTIGCDLCHPCSVKLKNKLLAKKRIITKEQAIAEIRATF